MLVPLNGVCWWMLIGAWGLGGICFTEIDSWTCLRENVDVYILGSNKDHLVLSISGAVFCPSKA